MCHRFLASLLGASRRRAGYTTQKCHTARTKNTHQRGPVLPQLLIDKNHSLQRDIDDGKYDCATESREKSLYGETRHEQSSKL